MPRSTSPTVPLYLRIPVGLRERLDAAAADGRSYTYKGAIADTAIRALSAGLDAIAPLTLVSEDVTPAKKARKASKTKRGGK